MAYRMQSDTQSACRASFEPRHVDHRGEIRQRSAPVTFAMVNNRLFCRRVMIVPEALQEEGRRHGGRRPIKVYAFTLMPATVRLEFGGRGSVTEA
jgi:hypothetical protein